MTDTPRCLAIRRCEVKCRAQAAARPHGTDTLWHRRCRPIDFSLKCRSFPTRYAIFVDIKARCVVVRSYVKSEHVGAEKEVKHAAHPPGSAQRNSRSYGSAVYAVAEVVPCGRAPNSYGCGKGVRGWSSYGRTSVAPPCRIDAA